MSTDFRELQKKNKRTTRLLLFASFFLVFFVSSILGLALTGFFGFAIFALIFSGVLTYVQYKQSSKIALRATGAVPADPDKYGQLHNCLLYTSPSPRDLSTSRMPSSA